MLPASGGNLSGGCNSAGSTSYDLISSGILLELNFFKVHFIGWSPSVGPRGPRHPRPRRRRHPARAGDRGRAEEDDLHDQPGDGDPGHLRGPRSDREDGQPRPHGHLQNPPLKYV